MEYENDKNCSIFYILLTNEFIHRNETVPSSGLPSKYVHEIEPISFVAPYVLKQKSKFKKCF